MKKISLLVSLTLCIMGLTSCLGEGSSKVSGSAIGILTGSAMFQTPVLTTVSGDVVSSPQLELLIATGDIIPGYCYSFYYELDYDLPENSSASLQVNGYYTVTISEIQDFPTYFVNTYPEDTTTALPDEVPVSNGCSTAPHYINGYAFIQQAVNQPSDMVLNWKMSYDGNTLFDPVEENGTRYYDLFVRAIGTGGTKSKVETPYLNAYQMSNFFNLAAENEKRLLGANYNNSSSTFSFRIFYVTEIKEDGTLTWQSYTEKGLIEAFLPEE
jgi:hypothetical protein